MNCKEIIVSPNAFTIFIKVLDIVLALFFLSLFIYWLMTGYLNSPIGENSKNLYFWIFISIVFVVVVIWNFFSIKKFKLNENEITVFYWWSSNPIFIFKKESVEKLDRINRNRVSRIFLRNGKKLKINMSFINASKFINCLLQKESPGP